MEELLHNFNIWKERVIGIRGVVTASSQLHALFSY
jgi:hypothetical protein